MSEELSRLLENGHEIIVREWVEKVTADRRINSDKRLSYVQLVDHIPHIVEELRVALAEGRADGRMLRQGETHGRQRWQQGYELKEVVRELTLLRATILDFFERYRGALRSQNAEEFSRSYRRINVFIDDEIYKTVEAFLEAPRNSRAN